MLPEKFSALGIGGRKGKYQFRGVGVNSGCREVLESDWAFRHKDDTLLIGASGEMFSFVNGSPRVGVGLTRGYGNLVRISFDLLDLVREGVKQREVSAKNLEVIKTWIEAGVAEILVKIEVLGTRPEVYFVNKPEPMVASEVGSIPGRPSHVWMMDKDRLGGLNGKLGVELYMGEVVIYFQTSDGKVAYRIRREVSEVPAFDRKFRDRWPTERELSELKEAIFI